MTPTLLQAVIMVTVLYVRVCVSWRGHWWQLSTHWLKWPAQPPSLSDVSSFFSPRLMMHCLQATLRPSEQQGPLGTLGPVWEHPGDEAAKNSNRIRGTEGYGVFRTIQRKQSSKFSAIIVCHCVSWCYLSRSCFILVLSHFRHNDSNDNLLWWLIHCSWMKTRDFRLILLYFKYLSQFLWLV